MALGDNDYYDNTSNIILPATSAEADDVENKCDDIVAGFTKVETDVGKAISLSHADNTNRDIPDAVGVRANKMLGCDSTGEFGLQVRRGTYKGDWTATTYFYQDDLITDAANALGAGSNSIFVANVNHTSSAALVTDTANWTLVIGMDELLSDYQGDFSVSGTDTTISVVVSNENGEGGLQVKDHADVIRAALVYDDNSPTGFVQLRTYDASGTQRSTLRIATTSPAFGGAYLDATPFLEITNNDGDCTLLTQTDEATSKSWQGVGKSGISGIRMSFDNTSNKGSIQNRFNSVLYNTLTFGNVAGELLLNDEQIAIESETVALDGSRDMTGNLNITKDSPIQTMQATNEGGICLIKFTDHLGTYRGSIFFSDTTGSVSISRKDDAGNAETSLTLGDDGNITVFEGFSGTPVPINDTHLVNKKALDDKFPGLIAGSFTTVDGKTVSYNADGVIISVV